MCTDPGYTSRISSRSAFTITEFIIGLAITGLVLAQICLLWFYSSRSFAAQYNYSDMDQKSQAALDLITKSVRQCKSLTNFSETKVVFVDFDDKLLNFEFANGNLIRTKGIEKPKILLNNCKSGQFLMYQRTPISGGFDYHATTDPTTCKLVEVSWVCSRKVFDSPSGPATTESMQSAKIVLRAK